MKLDEQSLNSDLIFGQISAFRGPPPGYAVMREFFAYQLPTFASVAAAGGQQTQNLLIQADSDFEWSVGVMQFDIASTQTTLATYFVPNMTIQIVDSGSGRQQTSAAVPVPTIFGPLVKPTRLPITKVFKANSNVAFTVFNNDAAVATANLRLTLLGWKIYYFETGRAFPEEPPQG